MKNILGKEEDLSLYNKEGKLIYEFNTDSDGFSRELIRDSRGNVLTYKNSNGISGFTTYDSMGNVLTYKGSDGNGFSSEYTYNSNGVSRGFDIPEYTMEELVEKLGNFKIKK